MSDEAVDLSQFVKDELERGNGEPVYEGEAIEDPLDTLETTIPGTKVIIATPVTIWPKHGAAVDVNDIGSWCVTPFGVFASGIERGQEGDAEGTNLWPWTSISRIEYHPEKLADEFLQVESEEEDAEDSPSD